MDSFLHLVFFLLLWMSTVVVYLEKCFVGFEVLTVVVIRPQRLRGYVPLKHRSTFNGLHGIVSQKIVLF
jgi:hypothetical protein